MNFTSIAWRCSVYLGSQYNNIRDTFHLKWLSHFMVAARCVGPFGQHVRASEYSSIGQENATKGYVIWLWWKPTFTFDTFVVVRATCTTDLQGDPPQEVRYLTERSQTPTVLFGLSHTTHAFSCQRRCTVCNLSEEIGRSTSSASAGHCNLLFLICHDLFLSLTTPPGFEEAMNDNQAS